MAIANIQAQIANLTSQVSRYIERTTEQSVPTFGISYRQEYQTHQCPQFTANGGAWGYQGHNQSRDNMFSNTYNSDWRDYSDYMWEEPQQFQQGGYWQQDEEFYSRPMQPPQPPPQQFQSTSSMTMTYDEIRDVLTSLTQGSQQEEYSQPSGEFYQWPCAPQQSAQSNSGTSLDNDKVLQLLTNLSQGQENQTKAMQNQDKRVGYLEKKIGQIVECIAQIQDQSELSNSNIVNSMGDFEITLGSNMEVEDDPKPSKHSPNVDALMLQEEEELLIEEEEQAKPTTRVEQSLPQPPRVPRPSNSGKIVPNSIHSNPIPPNVPFPRRFMISKNEESEKDIVEALPKVQNNVPILDTPQQVPDCVELFAENCTSRRMIQEKEVAGEYVKCIKEDVHEITKPKEVEFYDTGQVTTITFNLAKCKVPETFKDVVFVFEFVSEQESKPSFPISILVSTNLLILMIQAPSLEFKQLPDHFKYHRPFKDQSMRSKKGDLGIAPQSDLRS